MKLSKPDHFLSKKMGKAIFDYSLIGPGDRILVGISGGKDSLPLEPAIVKKIDSAYPAGLERLQHFISAPVQHRSRLKNLHKRRAAALAELSRIPGRFPA